MFPEPAKLHVTLATDKEEYAHGELPVFTVTAKMEDGEPVRAELGWGMRQLPDGEWVDYSREYSYSTDEKTGTVSWRWPDDDLGPPEPAHWEMAIDATARDDAGTPMAEGSAPNVTFRVVA